MCDLADDRGSTLEGRINLLHDELAQRQLAFQPHYWLSDECSRGRRRRNCNPVLFSAPRLEKLEESQMLEVEGDHEWA